MIETLQQAIEMRPTVLQNIAADVSDCIVHGFQKGTVKRLHVNLHMLDEIGNQLGADGDRFRYFSANFLTWLPGEEYLKSRNSISRQEISNNILSHLLAVRRELDDMLSLWLGDKNDSYRSVLY